jgi:hypothetical protein
MKTIFRLSDSNKRGRAKWDTIANYGNTLEFDIIERALLLQSKLHEYSLVTFQTAGRRVSTCGANS